MRKLLLLGFLLCPLVIVACDPPLDIITHHGGGGEGDGGAGQGVASSNHPKGSKGDGGSEDAGRTEEHSGDTPPPPPGGHKIDGVNDFSPGETFSTSSSAGSDPPYQGYFAWDDQRLYLGMSGADIASNSQQRWVMVYLGIPDRPGTRTGINYGGHQQPQLPFEANYHLRWKTSNDYSSVEVYENGAWHSGNAGVFPLTVQQRDKFVEMSIPRDPLGAEDTIAVHMNMLFEGDGTNDWTWAGVPANSFQDGQNPRFSHFLEFDLTSTKAPNSFAPL